MKILILTSINPTEVVETASELRQYNITNSLFSVQIMALLGEETVKQNYLPLMYAFTKEIKEHTTKYLPRDKKTNVIFYGNLDRNSKIKFDHIVAVDSVLYDKTQNTEDPHLKASNQLVQDAGLPIPDWYTYKDIEHSFPTFKHLHIFLKTLGVENDGI